MSNKKILNIISNIAGARFGMFLRLSMHYGVERKFLKKYLLSGLVSILCTFLWFFDRMIFLIKRKPKNTKPPVFIIGHWRSGTKYLHNLLCLSPESAFSTTYQTVFPNNLFGFQWLLKPIMKLTMTENRLVDNVAMHTDFPLEEEFALNNENEFSF